MFSFSTYRGVIEASVIWGGDGQPATFSIS